MAGGDSVYHQHPRKRKGTAWNRAWTGGGMMNKEMEQVINFFRKGMAACAGAEPERKKAIVLKVLACMAMCPDEQE